jgi:hypothetical protein
MNSPKLYAKPPEVLRCEKKGSAKNGNRVLKSFCQTRCEHRNGCEIKMTNAKKDRKADHLT